MSDVRHTFTDLENGTDAETVGVQVTVVQGAPALDGAPGVGVPVGGTTNQVLAKTSATDYATAWVDAAVGGGAVNSVNGKTGTVVLVPSDIGAGTSNLALGTTSTTAKAGNYQPTAANISDSTTVGRAVVTAVDAAAGRTAIGAGTSSLAIGITGTTAAAGNDSRLSDARTPTAHASTHASAGSDPLTLAESQVTNLVTDLAAKVPTTRTVAGHSLSADVTITNTDVGAAATSHTHAATDIASGTVATARLGSGTASSSTYLRGDQTWATVPGGYTDPLTTKGDLVVRSSSVTGRLGVGSDGQVLTADAASTNGVKWAASAGGGASTDPHPFIF